MAVEVDASTTGLWRFDEPSNQGALANPASFTPVVTAGYRSFLGESGVPSAETDQSSINPLATVNDPSNLLRFERTQAWTISGWVTFAGSGGGSSTTINGSVLSNAQVTTLRGITVGLSLTRRPKIKLTNTTTTNELVVRTTSYSMDDGRLHHIVYRYDGSSSAAGCQIWIDGVSQALTTEISNLTATIVGTGPLTIGGQGGTSSGNWIGTMQNMAVFNAAISPAAIAALFALGYNTPVPPQANLVATWRLDRTDDYVASQGILDRAAGGLGTFNATASNGFSTHVPWLYQVTAGRAPAITAGPRTAAAGKFVDTAWWATSLSGMGGASTGSFWSANAVGVGGQQNKRAWVHRMFNGDAYTVEGWYFINNPQTMSPFAFNTTSGGGNNLFTLFFLGDRSMRITWNNSPVRTTTSAINAYPLQTWFHLAVTCVRSVGSYIITVYVGGLVAHTATLTAPSPFDAFQSAISNECTYGISTSGGSPDEFAGGMAYMRLSVIARSVSEIQAAAADPTTIVCDANTVEFWSGQVGVQVYDQSPYGHHCARRGAIQGDATTWFQSPFDGYGVTGPTFNNLAHQFINTGSNLGYYAIPRQEVVDSWTGQSGATFEQFIRMDQDLGNHRLVRIGGSETTLSDSVNSNVVLQLDLLSNRAFRVFNEAASGYGWMARTTNAIIAQDATQSGEFGMFWCLAAVKRGAGTLNYWLLNGTTHWVNAGDIAAANFDRLTAFTVSFRYQRLTTLSGALEHLFGKMSSATGQGWCVRLDTSGRLEFRLDNGAGQAIERRVSSATYNDRLEHTITVVYTGTSTAAGVSIYVDGTLQTMTNELDTLASGSTLTTAPLSMVSRAGVDRFFPGFVREYAVWNAALSAGQVAAIGTAAGLPPPNLLALSSSGNLRGWWRFDQSDTASTVFDQSGVGNNATPQAGLTPTSQGVALWDIYKNAVLFETIGPIPAATVGNIYSEPDRNYTISLHTAGETHTKGISRMSNKARTQEELLRFFEQETGVPEPPTLEVILVSPIPVGSIIDTDEPLVCHVKSTQPFVRIMLNMSYPGFPFTEAVYTQNPADPSLGKVFEPLFSDSFVTEVADPDFYVYRFELRRNTPWPGSPQLKAYAFAGGGEA